MSHSFLRKACRRAGGAAAILAGCLWAAATADTHAADGSPAGGATEAFYVMSPSVERRTVPVTEVSLRVTGRETVEGRELVWWELAARPQDLSLIHI